MTLAGWAASKGVDGVRGAYTHRAGSRRGRRRWIRWNEFITTYASNRQAAVLRIRHQALDGPPQVGAAHTCAFELRPRR